MFDDIQRNLKKSVDSAINDKLAFEEWLQRKITIEECRERFFRNNNIHRTAEKRKITIDIFISWLHSLGW